METTQNIPIEIGMKILCTVENITCNYLTISFQQLDTLYKGIIFDCSSIKQNYKVTNYPFNQTPLEISSNDGSIGLSNTENSENQIIIEKDSIPIDLLQPNNDAVEKCPNERPKRTNGKKKTNEIDFNSRLSTSKSINFIMDSTLSIALKQLDIRKPAKRRISMFQDDNNDSLNDELSLFNKDCSSDNKKIKPVDTENVIEFDTDVIKIEENENQQFKDVFWGKINGHPWWPCLIIQQPNNYNADGDKQNFEVSWIGTSLRSKVSSNNLVNFQNEFKNKFRKNHRSSTYQKAVNDALYYTKNTNTNNISL